MELEEENRSPASLIIIRNALSYISRIAFQRRLSERQTVGLLTKRIRRRCTKRPTPESIWNPEVVITFYMRYRDNALLGLEELCVKCVLLVCLFTACRPGELATIDMGATHWYDDSVELSVQLKTESNRSFITVRRLEESRAKVCPFSLISFLWGRVQREYPDAKTLLVDHAGNPIKAKGIYRRIRQGFDLVGISRDYRPYSIKRAALSYLIRKGATLADTAQFARLSTSTDTVVKYYYKSMAAGELTELMGSSASHACNVSQEEEDSEPYLEL